VSESASMTMTVSSAGAGSTGGCHTGGRTTGSLLSSRGGRPSAQARPAAAIQASHRRARCPLRPCGTWLQPGVRTPSVRGGRAAAANGHCRSVRRAFRNCGTWGCRRVSGQSVSTADTAAAKGVRCWRKRSPGRAAVALMPPPPVRLGELAAEPVAELGAHVGHRRPLQRQRLLAGQPAELEALDVAAVPGGDDRAGGRLRVDPSAVQVPEGQARSSQVRSATNTSS
jgi:hypothetical protein